MRHASEFLAIVTLCLLSSLLRADDARDIVERGMKARCEKIELLKKQACEVISMKGTMLWTDQTEPEVIGEIKVDWPSSFRWDRDVVLPKDKMHITVSVQGDKGWAEVTPKPASDFDLVRTEEVQMEVHGRWVATLYPLKESAFALTALKDAILEKEEVAVVKATMRLRPDVYLSFSKKTGHLLKVAYKVRNAGTEVRNEHYFSDYRPFDGIALPTKMIDRHQIGSQPNVKDAEWTITNYKFVDKLAANTFEKPEKK